MANSLLNFNLETLRRELPNPIQSSPPAELLGEIIPQKTLLVPKATAPSESFHLFPTLPKELRLQIWECSLPPGSRKFRLRRRRPKKDGQNHGFPPLHALFHATSESRAVVQHHYFVIPQAIGLPVFVNPRKDTIVLTIPGLTKDNRFKWLENLSLAPNTSTLFQRIRKVVFFDTAGYTKTFRDVKSKDDPIIQRTLKLFPALEVVGVVFGVGSQMRGQFASERQELCDRVELFFGFGRKDMGRKTRASIIVVPL